MPGSHAVTPQADAGLLPLLLQEKPQGAVPEAWLAALAHSGVASSDMAGDLALLMSPKDDEEAKNVKKAAYLISNALTKFAVPQLEGEAGGGVAGEGRLGGAGLAQALLGAFMGSWRCQARCFGLSAVCMHSSTPGLPHSSLLQASSMRRRRCGTTSWRTRLRRSSQSHPRWRSSSR